MHFLFLFSVVVAVYCVFLICRKQVFVRQGALCCQQQERKIVSGDGAVKE